MKNALKSAIWITAALGLPRSAFAECPPPWSGVQATEACHLFGTDADVEGNRERRLAAIEAVYDGEYCVEVVSVEGRSDEPVPVTFADLELIDTFLHRDCDPVALVGVTPESPTDSCPAGAYVIGVDDSLGHDGQVLAVLDQLVLIELDKELRFLVTTGADPPVCWRMTWHPPWKLAPPSRGSTPPRPARRNARGRRR